MAGLASRRYALCKSCGIIAIEHFSTLAMFWNFSWNVVEINSYTLVIILGFNSSYPGVCIIWLLHFFALFPCFFFLFAFLFLLIFCLIFHSFFQLFVFSVFARSFVCSVILFVFAYLVLYLSFHFIFSVFLCLFACVSFCCLFVWLLLFVFVFAPYFVVCFLLFYVFCLFYVFLCFTSFFLLVCVLFTGLFVLPPYLLFVCLSVCLSVCLHVCLSDLLPVSLFVCFFLCLFLCLFVCCTLIVCFFFDFLNFHKLFKQYTCLEDACLYSQKPENLHVNKIDFNSVAGVAMVTKQLMVCGVWTLIL